MAVATLPHLRLRLQDSGQFYHYAHGHSVKMSTVVFIVRFRSGSMEIPGPGALKMQLLKKVSPSPPSVVSTCGLHPIPYRENSGERSDRLQKSNR